MATLDEAEEILTRWAEVAEAAWQARRGHRRRPRRRVRRPTSTASTRRPREELETLNGIHSNAAGFRRWLDKGGHSHTFGTAATPPASHGPGAGQHLH